MLHRPRPRRRHTGRQGLHRVRRRTARSPAPLISSKSFRSSDLAAFARNKAPQKTLPARPFSTCPAQQSCRLVKGQAKGRPAQGIDGRIGGGPVSTAVGHRSFGKAARSTHVQVSTPPRFRKATPGQPRIAGAGVVKDRRSAHPLRPKHIGAAKSQITGNPI